MINVGIPGMQNGTSEFPLVVRHWSFSETFTKSLVYLGFIFSVDVILYKDPLNKLSVSLISKHSNVLVSCTRLLPSYDSSSCPLAAQVRKVVSTLEHV